MLVFTRIYIRKAHKNYRALQLAQVSAAGVKSARAACSPVTLRGRLDSLKPCLQNPQQTATHGGGLHGLRLRRECWAWVRNIFVRISNCFFRNLLTACRQKSTQTVNNGGCLHGLRRRRETWWIIQDSQARAKRQWKICEANRNQRRLVAWFAGEAINLSIGSG